MVSPTMEPMDACRHNPADDALKAETDTTMVNARMPTAVYDELCRIALARRTTVSALMRAAVKLFLRNIGPN